MRCLFASDLHGREGRYDALFGVVASEIPDAVFLGGDLLPFGGSSARDFVRTVLSAGFASLREALGEQFPAVFLIFGNDDPRALEDDILEGERLRLWTYMHNRVVPAQDLLVWGYSCVPPTPFLLKDWERYDVSYHLDPGCIAPEEGWTTADPPAALRYATMEDELARLAGDSDLSSSIFLFHAPPYQTLLDRAALDGKSVDHVPLDVNVGSIAIRRFIEARQPLVTLHGHVHESARLTGGWKQRIGRTVLLGAAHDGPELALVRFDPRIPEEAARELIKC